MVGEAAGIEWGDDAIDIGRDETTDTGWDWGRDDTRVTGRDDATDTGREAGRELWADSVRETGIDGDQSGKSTFAITSAILSDGNDIEDVAEEATGVETGGE